MAKSAMVAAGALPSATTALTLRRPPVCSSLTPNVAVALGGTLSSFTLNENSSTAPSVAECDRRRVVNVANAVLLLEEQQARQPWHVQHRRRDALERVGHVDLHVEYERSVLCGNGRQLDAVGERGELLLARRRGRRLGASHCHANRGAQRVRVLELDEVVGRRAVAVRRRGGEAMVGRGGPLDGARGVLSDE
eukprot:682015-Prymnesium_polylepis.1